MITKEEFLYLYEKNLSGDCTPEEKILLESYQDDIQLPDKKWDPSLGDKKALFQNIQAKLSQNVSGRPVSKPSYNQVWLKAAAVALIVLSLGILLFQFQNRSVKQQLTVNHAHISIKPGGNMAYLTLPNGSIITLDKLKNGQLSSQSGVNITKVKDGVLTYSKDASNTQQQAEELALNMINTPRGGQYEVVLSDGTRVWLNSASALKYPTSFSGKTRKVELTGEAYFEVTKNKAQPFEVTVNGITVQVLGTHFNINGYEDEKVVKTTLLEGAVRLVKNHAQALLKPGEQGFLNTQQTAFNVKPVDTDDAVAWKNGFFAFNNEDIQSIMKRISRWYDVDVVFPDNFKRRNFGGTVSRFKDVSEVLNALELTGSVHFKTEGRRITVMP